MAAPAPLAPRRAAYDDVLRSPPHLVAEIIDGVLDAPAAGLPARPGCLHPRREARPPFKRGKGGPGGWILLDESELHLGSAPDIPVPDLAGWRRETMPVLPEAAFLTVRPDWVCEVLSPATSAPRPPLQVAGVPARERGAGLAGGPGPRTLEVLELDGPSCRLLGTYADDDPVRAPPFDAIVLDLAVLWLR